MEQSGPSYDPLIFFLDVPAYYRRNLITINDLFLFLNSFYACYLFVIRVEL